jgi:hypothetical protein
LFFIAEKNISVGGHHLYGDNPLASPAPVPRIPSHPALKKKPTQTNIRAMTAAEHPAFASKKVV